MEAGIGVLLCLYCLVVWVGCRIEDTRARRRNCAHRWLEPTIFAGYWTRHCQLCGTQEPCPPPRGDDDDAR